jgi:hypothetical protein
VEFGDMHQALKLTGTAPDATSGTVTQPVAWWFEQPAQTLLKALADPANGWVTPREPTASRFITELASGNHPMADVLREVAPGTAHRTWRTIAIDWIAAGCPLPAQAPTPALPTTAAVSPVAAEAATPEPLAKAPAQPAGAPVTVATAATSEDRMAAQPAPKVPLLGLFQNETWQGTYDDVPVYGNGALH